MFAPQDPESLLKIFSLEKKRDLEKHCKDITIHQVDFAALIWACEESKLPWQHQILSRSFAPKHLEPTNEDFLILLANGVGELKGKAAKVNKKTHQLFVDRRYLVGHIFHNQDFKNWHFFYFDQRDFDDFDNHWEHGPHIHLLNHLWPNLDGKVLWENFSSGNVKLNGSIHIRFRTASSGA
jgi:hypothetical protein